MIELVKLMMPVPSDVLVLNATVGAALVLQQTPRAVTGAPPSVVIEPPEVAEVNPIEVTTFVISTGMTATTDLAVVVKNSSDP